VDIFFTVFVWKIRVLIHQLFIGKVVLASYRNEGCEVYEKKKGTRKISVPCRVLRSACY